MLLATFCSVDSADQDFFTKALGNNDSLQLAMHNQTTATAPLDPATEILSVFVSDTVSSDTMARLPKLKLIACRSTGIDNIDILAAKKRGIKVVNIPSYGETAVAEYTFALLLSLTRRIAVAAAQPTQHTRDRNAERGIDLHGLTIGVVGTGAIGMSVARIAKGFGMRIAGYDPMPNIQAAQRIGLTYVPSLIDLLKTSDIVSLHAPFTGTNRHMLNAKSLQTAKPGIIVINTARGELIDTAALAHAIKAGHVAAAGLDVIEGDGAALAAFPQVIITNHNAYNTVQAVERINTTTVTNIMTFLKSASAGAA